MLPCSHPKIDESWLILGLRVKTQPIRFPEKSRAPSSELLPADRRRLEERGAALTTLRTAMRQYHQKERGLGTARVLIQLQKAPGVFKAEMRRSFSGLTKMEAGSEHTLLGVRKMESPNNNSVLWFPIKRHPPAQIEPAEARNLWNYLLFALAHPNGSPEERGTTNNCNG